MRLFLGRFYVALNEAASDHETGIAICVAAHLALWAEAERRAWGVAAHGLSFGITHDEAMTAMAFSGRVARVDPAGDDPAVPCFIFGEVEDPPLHPESSLRVPPCGYTCPFQA